MFRTNQPSPFFPISSSCSYEVRSEVPPFLLHGTSTTTLPVILKEGLKRMSRQFVHMTEDPATATKTGIRLHVDVCVSLESVMLVSYLKCIPAGSRQAKDGAAVAILQIDAQQMHADGFVFHRADNNVWLTEQVPSKYLSPYSGAVSRSEE
jgi:putative RNA 2'-phosphotransferase